MANNPDAAGRPLDLAGKKEARYRYEPEAMAIVNAIKRDLVPDMDSNDGGEILCWILDLCEKIQADLAASRPGEPSETSVERYDHATAVHAQEREREYRRTLWAAAATVHPQPLRVAQCCRDNYAPDCELQTRTDLTTGDLLIYAPAPPKDADQ